MNFYCDGFFSNATLQFLTFYSISLKLLNKLQGIFGPEMSQFSQRWSFILSTRNPLLAISKHVKHFARRSCDLIQWNSAFISEVILPTKAKRIYYFLTLKCNTELNTALSNYRIWAITLDKQTTKFIPAILCKNQIFNCTINPIEDFFYNLSLKKSSHKEVVRQNIDLHSFLLSFKTKTWAATQENEWFLTFKHEELSSSGFGFSALSFVPSCNRFLI